MVLKTARAHKRAKIGKLGFASCSHIFGIANRGNLWEIFKEKMNISPP